MLNKVLKYAKIIIFVITILTCALCFWYATRVNQELKRSKTIIRDLELVIEQSRERIFREKQILEGDRRELELEREEIAKKRVDIERARGYNSRDRARFDKDKDINAKLRAIIDKSIELAEEAK